MALSDEDVKEILRLIDESDVSELRIETDGFSLHVIRGDAEPAALQSPISNLQSQSANGATTIDAPMLGTFYRAEAPGAEPFVDVGAKVSADTTVCLIEVMKMMNSIPAGVEGTIVEVCAENAQLVEFGQPLFRVEPA